MCFTTKEWRHISAATLCCSISVLLFALVYLCVAHLLATLDGLAHVLQPCAFTLLVATVCIVIVGAISLVVVVVFDIADGCSGATLKLKALNHGVTFLLAFADGNSISLLNNVCRENLKIFS